MIYVMSDIHGCIDQYHKMLHEINFSASDHLYILDDVIDRFDGGIALLLEIMAQNNVTLLLGNHEDMMLRALQGKRTAHSQRLWFQNGGDVTRKHFMALSQEEQDAVLGFLNNLPIEETLTVQAGAEERKYLLVHAAPLSAFDQKTSDCANAAEHALWFRLRRGNEDMPGMPSDATVIFGHTPTWHFVHREPMRIYRGTRMIDIDCGCAHGARGQLACLCLDDGKEFYVQ